MQIHFLVEGVNEKRALDVILPKIILNNNVRYKIHPFEGKGNINKKPHFDKNDKSLFGNIVQQLRAYNSSSSMPEKLAVVILFDLDDDPSCVELKQKVVDVVKKEAPNIISLVRIAIEEFESWYLGDVNAICKAYKNVNESTFKKYKQDSIICTWEFILNKIYPKVDIHSLGFKKRELAERIPPLMDIESNESPSFKAFVIGIRKLISDCL